MSRTVKRRPKTVMPTRQSYDLDTLLGGRGGDGGFGARDELDDAMRQAHRLQADNLKSKIIENTQLKIERENMDLKKGMGAGGGGGAPTLAPEELSYITALPEDQRGTAIQALASFKAQSGGGSTGSLGPLLVMSMLQQKPQASVGEMVVALKGLNDIMQTGKAPGNSIDSVIGIARLLLEFKDKDQMAVTEVYKRMLDERNVDPLQQTETVINLAKALGYSPQGAVHPDIERMKIDHETSMQKSDQEFQLLLKKMDKDDKRTETIINMLESVLRPFADRAGGAVAGMIGGAAGASLAQPHTPIQVGGPLAVKCPNCGFEPIWVSEDTPVGICQKCGQQVTHPQFKDRVGASPPPGPPSSGPSPPPPGPGAGLPPPPG